MITGLGAAVLALTAAWLVSARHAADPVIPLRLFRDQTVGVACAISLIIGIGMLGAISCRSSPASARPPPGCCSCR